MFIYYYVHAALRRRRKLIKPGIPENGSFERFSNTEQLHPSDLEFEVRSETLENGVEIITYVFTGEYDSVEQLTGVQPADSLEDKLMLALSRGSTDVLIDAIREHCTNQKIFLRGICFSEGSYEDQILYLRPFSQQMDQNEYIRDVKQKIEKLSIY